MTHSLRALWQLLHRSAHWSTICLWEPCMNGMMRGRDCLCFSFLLMKISILHEIELWIYKNPCSQIESLGNKFCEIKGACWFYWPVYSFLMPSTLYIAACTVNSWLIMRCIGQENIFRNLKVFILCGSGHPLQGIFSKKEIWSMQMDL